MDELERRAGFEGPLTDQELEEGHAERVEIAAIDDLAPGSAAQFGRDVGQRAFEHLGFVDEAALILEQHRDAEVGQVDLAAGILDQDVAGLDVAVNDAARVNLAERVDQPDRHPREVWQRDRPTLGVLAEVAALDVLEQQDQLVADPLERERPDDPWHVEGLQQPKFVTDAGLDAGLVDAKHLGQHALTIAVALGLVDARARRRSQNLSRRQPGKESKHRRAL